jgi:hypothetical protein
MAKAEAAEHSEPKRKPRTPGSYTPAELEVLENLTKRREELEERARAQEVQA